MKIINFWGGPSCGKSTMAAETYAYLKRKGVSTELVRERLKIWSMENKNIDVFDNSLAFAKQAREQRRYMKLNVENIIVDAPLAMYYYFGRRKHSYEAKYHMTLNHWLAMEELAQDMGYKTLNLVMDRDESIAYESFGRKHDLNSAIEHDKNIKIFMKELKINTYYLSEMQGLIDGN